MDEYKGFIKLDRKILKWRHFKNHRVLAVFLYLLIKAQYGEESYVGTYKIKRGEVVTSYQRIAEETGLTYAQVRLVISLLTKTGEIETKKSQHFSLVKIKNYEEYQGFTGSNNSLVTVSTQSDDSLMTVSSQHYKKDKKDKKDKKEKNIGRSAPESPSGTRSEVHKVERDEYGHIKLKSRDEGTYEDIPEIYREFCQTYQEYYDYVER